MISYHISAISVSTIENSVLKHFNWTKHRVRIKSQIFVPTVSVHFTTNTRLKVAYKCNMGLWWSLELASMSRKKEGTETETISSEHGLWLNAGTCL